MYVCGSCGQLFGSITNFCTRCGKQIVAQPPQSHVPEASQPPPPAYGFPRPYSPQVYPPHASPTHPQIGDYPHHGLAHGFAQMFGLHPAVAALTLMVDTMLFGGELASAGFIFPLSICTGAILGLITYKAQIKWYGDDKESALVKAVTLALLTAIPTNLPGLLYVPAGILGFFNRRKKMNPLGLRHRI